MSTPPYLTLISELLPVQRRDFSLAVPGILNPLNANPLLDGEWLSFDSSGLLVRASGNVEAMSWQVLSLKGQYDVQAINKVPVAYMGPYEAETSICDPTSVVIGSMLVVDDVTVGGQTKKGLKLKAAAADTYWVRAYCTKVVSATVIRYIVPGGPSIIVTP